MASARREAVTVSRIIITWPRFVEVDPSKWYDYETKQHADSSAPLPFVFYDL